MIADHLTPRQKAYEAVFDRDDKVNMFLGLCTEFCKDFLLSELTGENTKGLASSGQRKVTLGPEISPWGAAGSWSTELDFGLGELGSALLFLTTAFGHTEGYISVGIGLGCNAHLAIWSRFSSSLFLLAHACDPWAWKHLLTASPSNTRVLSRSLELICPVEITYLRNISK